MIEAVGKNYLSSYFKLLIFSNKLVSKVSLLDGSIENNSNTTELIVNAPIPAGSSLELIDGGAKIILKSGDKLKAKSDTASSLKAIVSFIDAISS